MSLPRDGRLSIDVLGIGVIGPGLANWPQARAVLRGEVAYATAPTVIPPPQRLPATERRRAGTIIKVSIVAADEALAMSGLDAADVATVFSASEGDGRNCHELCEALAQSDRTVSPTRFTNSVHNAPAGYWHIATHSMAPSTSLCAFDASFAMGLLEAAQQACEREAPVLLVVADAPYPEPLHAVRPLPDAMAIAMVITTSSPPAANTIARLEIAHQAGAAVPGNDASLVPSLVTLASALPAARGLPMLGAVARGDHSACEIACFEDHSLRVKCASR